MFRALSYRKIIFFDFISVADPDLDSGSVWILEAKNYPKSLTNHIKKKKKITRILHLKRNKCQFCLAHLNMKLIKENHFLSIIFFKEKNVK